MEEQPYDGGDFDNNPGGSQYYFDNNIEPMGYVPP